MRRPDNHQTPPSMASGFFKKKRGKKTILCVDERRREMGKDFVGIKKKKEDGR